MSAPSASRIQVCQPFNHYYERLRRKIRILTFSKGKTIYMDKRLLKVFSALNVQRS